MVIEEVEMLGNENMVYRAGEPIKIKLRLKAKDKKMEFFFKLVVMSADEKPIGIAVAPDPLSIEPGEDRRISVVFNPGEFTPGRYTMGFMLSRELLRTKNMKEIHDYIHNVISFEIKADEKNPGMVWNQNFGSVRLRDLVVS